jgi:hypothetical protein
MRYLKSSAVLDIKRTEILFETLAYIQYINSYRYGDNGTYGFISRNVSLNLYWYK